MNTHFVFGILFVATGMIASIANAQSPSANNTQQTKNLPPSLQESLKDIPAAGMACLNEDYLPKQKPNMPRTAKKLQPGCAITLEQLFASPEQKEAVLVDTRPKTEFDKSHIDGAVNFTAAELRTKRYLMNKPLILIGDGKTDHDLLEVCSELKEAGFKQSKVLRGGLLAWIADNKPVVGVTPRVVELARLNPDELFRQSKLADNFLLGLPSMHTLTDVLPMEVNSPKSDLESLKDLVRKRKRNNAEQNVVLIADERFDMTQLPELIKAAKPAPLLFYAGSDTAYREYLRMQNAMWIKHAKGPNKPSCGAR